MASKTAIVTGGSRGIGRAIVEKLVREGYFTAFTYNTNSSKVPEIQEACGADNVLPFQWSAGKSVEAFENLLQAFKQDGRTLDLLVNNAGITRDGLFALSSTQDFTEVVDANLVGMAAAARAVIRTMISQRSGVIVNISSIAGHLGTAGQAAYSASKAGISAFTRSLAREVGQYGIRVVCVAPGFIQTDMLAKVPAPLRKQYLERVPLRRAGNPEEIAEVVRFLGGEGASYINGTTIVVDGGVS